MNCTSDGLFAAMDSITKDKKWGDEAQPIEEVLAPDDWRLIEIHKFQDRLEIGDVLKRTRIIKRILTEIDKFDFSDDAQKGTFLYEMGLSGPKVAKVIGKPNRWVQINCVRLARRKNKWVQTDLQQVLDNIIAHEKKVGMR